MWHSFALGGPYWISCGERTEEKGLDRQEEAAFHHSYRTDNGLTQPGSSMVAKE